MGKRQPTCPRQRPKRLMLPVEYDEDFTTFCSNLLYKGYAWWLCDADGYLRPKLENKVLPIPLQYTQTWKAWKRALTPALRRFWEEYTEHDFPKPRRRNYQHQCYRLIEQIVSTLNPDPDARPLTPYRLTKLMVKATAALSPAPSSEVLRKYARQWFIYQKLRSHLPLTKSERRFWHRHPYYHMGKVGNQP